MSLHFLHTTQTSCGVGVSITVAAHCTATISPLCGAPPAPTIRDHECKHRRHSGPTRLSSKGAIRRKRRSLSGPGLPPWIAESFWMGIPGGGGGPGDDGPDGGGGGYGGGGYRGSSSSDDEYYGRPWRFWLWHMFCVLNLANTVLFAARNTMRTAHCALV